MIKNLIRLFFHSKIKKLQIDEKSLVIVTIPVGNMPTHEIPGFLTDIAKILKSEQKHERDWLYVPARPDGEGAKVEVLNPGENGVLVMKIPCGSMIGNMREGYLKDIRNQVKLPFGFKDILVLPSEVEVSNGDAHV